MLPHKGPPQNVPRCSEVMMFREVAREEDEFTSSLVLQR